MMLNVEFHEIGFHLAWGPFDSSNVFFRFHQLYWKMGKGLIGRWVEICQALSHAISLEHNSLQTQLPQWGLDVKSPGRLSPGKECVGERRVKCSLHMGKQEGWDKHERCYHNTLVESVWTVPWN
jgi:hypothetical protein